MANNRPLPSEKRRAIAQLHSEGWAAVDIAKRVDVWELHNGKRAERLYVIGEVVDVERRLADILSVIDRLRPSLVIWDTLSRHMSIAGWNLSLIHI